MPIKATSAAESRNCINFWWSSDPDRSTMPYWSGGSVTADILHWCTPTITSVTFFYIIFLLHIF